MQLPQWGLNVTMKGKEKDNKHAPCRTQMGQDDLRVDYTYAQWGVSSVRGYANGGHMCQSAATVGQIYKQTNVSWAIRRADI